MALNELIEGLRAKRLKEVSEKKVHRKESASEAQKAVAELSGEPCSDAIRSQVYKKIIERYSDTIGLMEEKTIPELKAMVNPEDAAIAGVKESLFEQLKAGNPAWEYSFETVFPNFLKAALNYAYSLKPVNADLSISYWLKPSEIVELKAADPFDRAIFLCSVLVSAGGSAKVRMLELEGGARHAVVLCGFAGKVILLDPTCSNAPEESPTEEDVLAKHELKGKRIARSLYEFSNLDYTSFED